MDLIPPLWLWAGDSVPGTGRRIVVPTARLLQKLNGIGFKCLVQCLAHGKDSNKSCLASNFTFGKRENLQTLWCLCEKAVGDCWTRRFQTPLPEPSAHSLQSFLLTGCFYTFLVTFLLLFLLTAHFSFNVLFEGSSSYFQVSS